MKFPGCANGLIIWAHLIDLSNDSCPEHYLPLFKLFKLAESKTL